MSMKTKLLAAGAFVMLMSILAGAWPLVLLGLVVIGWLAFGRWRAVSGQAKSETGKVVELSIAAPSTSRLWRRPSGGASTRWCA